MKRQLSALAWGWLLAALLTSAAFAAAPGQEEWERVLQAAKKEGKVSMIGPVGADRRDALTIAFEKKYGISRRVSRRFRRGNFTAAQRRA